MRAIWLIKMYVTNAALAALLSGAPIVTFELMVRLGLLREGIILRKTLHVLSSGAVIVAAHAWGLQAVVAAAVIFIAAFTFMRANKVMWRSLDSSAQGQSYGDVAFAVGVLVAALWAEPPVFNYAVAAMGLADTAGWVIGRAVFGSKKKSLAGCIAVWVTAFALGLILLPDLMVLPLLLLATCVAIAELVSRRGADNAAIPVAVVLLLSI